MIEIKHVGFTYANSDSGTLTDISLEIKKGECVLLCGRSGCGKTTVTRLLNGLIPHYYEGTVSGSVAIDKLEVTKAELYETSKIVGSVFQNPRSQFFCVDTTSEIAFGCENMGLPVNTVRERIAQAAQELNVTKLLGRNIFHLSGGEKQKIACASISAMQPEIFVLDEPTSNLDVNAIEDLRNTLLSWKAAGKTIVIAEHRLYWLKDICDRVVYIQDGSIAFDIPMKAFLEFSTEHLAKLGLRSLSMEAFHVEPMEAKGGAELILKDYCFSFDGLQALNIPQLSVPIGGMIAVIGLNGAGKSTFSKCFCGLERKFKGKAVFDGTAYGRREMLKKSYLVMQDVNHQLFCESVMDEIQLGMDEENMNDVDTILKELGLADLSQRHPMSLSGGQKQRVAIASAILANKEFLIFDEPTSGLDFQHMEQTAGLLRSLWGRKTAFIITHDPELIVRCCTHVLKLEQGCVADFYPLFNETKNRFADFFYKNNN
ncbi:MAG: ABC transporter ATP-binding protein [Anaerotignum sp.]|nr:ABC transporter ATP-binding protein [Anaerotignum sp.]